MLEKIQDVNIQDTNNNNYQTRSALYNPGHSPKFCSRDTFELQSKKAAKKKKNGLVHLACTIGTVVLGGVLVAKFHKPARQFFREMNTKGIDEKFEKSLDSDLKTALKAMDGEDFSGLKQSVIRKKLLAKCGDLGQEHLEKKEYKDAQRLLTKAAKGEKEPEKLTKLHKDTAYCHKEMGNYENAVKEYKKALNLEKDLQEASRLKNDIGCAEAQIKKYEVAKNYFNEAAKDLETKAKYNNIITTAYQNEAAALMESKDYAGAIESLVAALKHVESPIDVKLISAKLDYCVYKKLENESAEEISKKVLELAENINLKNPGSSISVIDKVKVIIKLDSGLEYVIESKPVALSPFSTLYTYLTK